MVYFCTCVFVLQREAELVDVNGLGWLSGSGPQSALHVAAGLGLLAMARTLLALGADLALCSGAHAQTAAHVAARHGQSDVSVRASKTTFSSK